MVLSRFLRWAAGFTGILLIAAAGSIAWLGSAAGERWICRSFSAAVSRQIPGTQVHVHRLRPSLPFRLTAQDLLFGRVGEPPLLEVEEPSFSGRAWEGWRGGFRWSFQGRVKRLDLARLDEVVAHGSWMTQGTLLGPVEIFGIGSRVAGLRFQLETQAPGGAVSGEWLGRLLALMPAGDARSALRTAVGTQPSFRFRIGTLRAETQGTDYLFHLVLDGDHLLDITVRVPQESVGILVGL